MVLNAVGGVAGPVGVRRDADASQSSPAKGSLEQIRAVALLLLCAATVCVVTVGVSLGKWIRQVNAYPQRQCWEKRALIWAFPRCRCYLCLGNA